jgi:hypothetical protein
MAVLLITYDLNGGSRLGIDYTDFYKTRDSFDHIKLAECTYALNTAETPGEVKGKLERFIDRGDQIYIITLKRPFAGYGPTNVNRWLNDNIRP